MEQACKLKCIVSQNIKNIVYLDVVGSCILKHTLAKLISRPFKKL